MGEMPKWHLRRRSTWIGLVASGQAMIQGVLKADEFPDERVIAAVGLRSFVSEVMVEFEFRTVIAEDGQGHESRPAQTGPGDADQAGGDGASVLLEVREAFENPIRARQAGESFL